MIVEAFKQCLLTDKPSWLESVFGLGVGDGSRLVVYCPFDLPVNAVPRAIHVPSLGSIRTELKIIETPVAQFNTTMERPIRPGSSISRISGEAGTAAVQVYRKVGYGALDRYVLSCEHVLFPGGIGETDVVQPASEDGYAWGKEDSVAHAFDRAGLSGDSLNYVDAAIARLDGDIMMTNHPIDWFSPISDIDDDIRFGDEVVMIGRTTGVSEGEITDISVDLPINYRIAGGDSVFRFGELVSASYECDGGDSGAPVINKRTNRLIGLHMAGIDGMGYCCRISRVFESLQIGLL